MKKMLTICFAVVMIVILFFVIRSLHYIGEVDNLDSMIQSGNVDGVSKLINTRPQLLVADLEAKGRMKLTPLALAAATGQETICSSLITAGANVNAQDKVGQTPLQYAVNGNLKTSIVAMLLQHGADPTLKNIDGSTPLFNAVSSGNTNVIIMLLQHGADPALKDRYGNTPLDLAKKSNVNEDAIKILSEAISKAVNKAATNGITNGAH